jgi:hypothetical protein
LFRRSGFRFHVEQIPSFPAYGSLINLFSAAGLFCVQSTSL